MTGAFSWPTVEAGASGVHERPPMSDPLLTAVTNLGSLASSQRVRLHEWLKRRQVRCDIWDYVGSASSSPQELLRHPAKLVAAEALLRARVRSHRDLVLLVREASPFSRGDVERTLLRNASFATYDFDDALQWDTGAGEWYRRFAPKASKTLISVKEADQVIAGNEVLADWASGFNASVVVIPTCVDVADYAAKSDYRVGPVPRLVWIGSPNNEHHLEMIARPLLELHRRSGARLTVISGSPRAPLPTLEVMIDRVAWSIDVQRTRLTDSDVGIMPLPDRDYERGKCGYKLLQYAAAGLPCIGSPVGANRKILADLGMPAPTNDDDWLDALRQAIDLPSTARRDQAQRARRAVELRWSYSVWAQRWEDAVLGRAHS